MSAFDPKRTSPALLPNCEALACTRRIAQISLPNRPEEKRLGGVNASLHSIGAGDSHANYGVGIAIICSGASEAEDWFAHLQNCPIDRLTHWFATTDGMPVCAGRTISAGILCRSTQQIGARHRHQR